MVFQALLRFMWHELMLTFAGVELQATTSTNHHTVTTTKQYTGHVVEVHVETTDPCLQGCGVTYASTELFKPETTSVCDAYGREIGCKIGLHAAGNAAF
ncbi:hypothetical protein BBBOND_0105230 [Babesia bigemina]|uniref:Uncharacterized protein n=1 Tax=Babesia bigemina TaxID=5866 RepID=A0A061D5H0_BABBI|nr:hypothetical protein BBBOND_0105230 [Babesia bigemina]CDR94214.1 hypothetical protein BBBOND_0105230 [Babesia bigemina]|eukprot:XP_012766400.1 hypothetical protein BBBOND_0105230 [Babesia bigemina]